MLVSVEFNSAQYRRINVRGRGIVKEPLKVNIISLRERREREREWEIENGWIKGEGKIKTQCLFLKNSKHTDGIENMPPNAIWSWQFAHVKYVFNINLSYYFFFNFRIILYRFAWNPKRMEMDDFFLLNKFFFGPMDHTSWTKWTKIWLYTIYY